jgi:2-C-methyl-D-erythritol 4-phosphate cytidylyltransferase
MVDAGSGRVAVVLPAAGRGERLGAAHPKAFLSVAGWPLLGHTLRRFATMPCVGQAIVAVPPGYLDALGELVARGTPWPFPIDGVEGGRERQDSIVGALAAIRGPVDVVVIHDAVRPFVSMEVVVACIEGARRYGAAIAAVPLEDTLKRADGDRVRATVDRRGLWRAQTPQAFRIELLREAHARARETGLRATDDAGLVEWAGTAPRIVPGDPRNTKITTAADLHDAEGRLVSGA